MSVLVLMLCLNGTPCTERTAPDIMRVRLQSMLCQDWIPKIVAYVRDNDLNPANGFYSLKCLRQEPEA